MAVRHTMARTRACAKLCALLFAIGCLLSRPAFPSDDQKPTASDVLGLLKQLNSVAIDRSEVYAVRNARLTRDRMTLYLNRGFVVFMTKAGGEVTGAIFSGDGEILMIPPTVAEKRNLAQFTQAAVLEERFDSAYLRFTDQTARELLAAAEKPNPDDPDQPDEFLEEWGKLAPSLGKATSVRILTDLVGDRSLPYFYARLHGLTLGLFELAVDERMSEAFNLGALRKIDSDVFADVWCSFPTASSATHLAALHDGSAKALGYTLDVRILPDHSIAGRAEVQLESRSPRDRVLAFALSRWLAVTAVKDDRGRNLTLLEDVPEGSSPSLPRASDQIAIVLPEPYPAGSRFRLTFEYRGNVIANVGNGVLYVGARGIWYPNLGLASPATYDITFHYPEKVTLVATGNCVEQKATPEGMVSHWRSDGVFRVAGFNLGRYTSVERRAGKIPVAVYAANEAESAIENQRDKDASPGPIIPGPRGESLNPFHQLPRMPALLAPSAYLDQVADIAAGAVDYYSSLFGPFPYSHVAISQVPGSFGQGWPELVYLPSLSFLPKSDRADLGLNRRGADPLGPIVVAHEIAHQWWGNLVGWQTYHDQWLSEGLASYAAALYVAHEKDGDRQFRNLLHTYKEDLLAKTSEGHTIESGGPIWLGQRLSSSLDPEGYPNIVYKKACWVLHMLRGLMTDPKTGSDEQFFRMLRDFLNKYQGQSVSTEDFVRHAAKYMTSSSDLERNHKLDWFFDEWVYESGIPSYHVQTDMHSLGGDKYLVQGVLQQKNVPASFEMPVPLVAQYGKDRRVPLGRVVSSETGTRFKFTLTRKPSHVTVDEDNLLAVVH